MPVGETLFRSPALRSRWAYVRGLPMHARVSEGAMEGPLPPVVLVHGQVVSSRYMEPLASRLARATQVYVPDLPGFGRSTRPPQTLDAPELAVHLASWMEAAGPSSAAVVGNSFGCQIAAELAARAPARVRRLVLQGPTIDRHARAALPQIGRWLRAGPRERPSLGAVMMRDYLSAGFRRARETFEAVLSHEIESVVPHIRAPTLIVRGSRDPIVPARWAEELAALTPDARVAVVPGGGHTLNYSEPLALARVILGFLRPGSGVCAES